MADWGRNLLAAVRGVADWDEQGDADAFLADPAAGLTPRLRTLFAQPLATLDETARSAMATWLGQGEIAGQAALSLRDLVARADLRHAFVRRLAARWLAEGTTAAQAIAELDELLTVSVDAILHHPRLQSLEALWRNTHWLIDGCPASGKLRIALLDGSWAHVARDLERASTATGSALYNKLYGQGLGIAGGLPFGMLVVDHQVSHRPSGDTAIDDVTVLQGMAEIAATCFCPIVIGAHPRLLGMDGFDDLDLRHDLGGTFAAPAYEAFRKLQRSLDARFIACTLPRILVRAPHKGRSFRAIGFRYDERVEQTTDLLWGSSAFAMASTALRAMAQYRWPASVRGAWAADSGGLVDGPARVFLPSDRPGVVVRFPTENAVSENQELALNAAGLIALRQCHLTGSAAFFNVPTLHAPTALHDVNARMGAMLNYVLCVSRFAHYIKVQAREWIGSFVSADDCQRRLQEYINGYVIDSDDSSEDDRAKYPLRQAEILVFERPGSPGAFEATVSLQPHFQLDQTNADFVLATQIGRAVA